MPFTREHQEQLLKVACAAIQHGLTYQQTLTIQAADYPEELLKNRASFVTLMIKSELRGCIGAILPTQPLVKDVAYHAYAAAFHDPRFKPLTPEEYILIDIHISVLSTPELLKVSSEAQLIEQLRPGIDGLILQEGYRKGTFLPSVWDALKTPELFISRLKLKAGFPIHYWSKTIQVQRYTTESFGISSCTRIDSQI